MKYLWFKFNLAVTIILIRIKVSIRDAINRHLMEGKREKTKKTDKSPFFKKKIKLWSNVYICF